jgi:predicted NACHT family NTPase
MARQSLSATEKGIGKAKQAFMRTELTHKQLAAEVGLKTRYSIWKFFKGESIERSIFKDICDRLDLDWEEIAAPKPLDQEYDISLDSNTLVQKLREKVRPRIQQGCGTLRVLDMTQPIGLIDIYTNVDLLEQLTSDRRLKITQLLQNFNPELPSFDRIGLSRITDKRILGVDAVRHHPKLMVLGKPGSGKTTFLKYIAIQCSSGNLLGNLVPIFITIRDFAEAKNQPSCLEFIAKVLSSYSITDTQITEVIKQGKALILLDGLDEIIEKDTHRVIKEIREFSDQYHTNQFVITCRLAAREYMFEAFTEVEVADFNDKQIQTFVTKWFQAKESDTAERFMEQLRSNPPIRELATNPLLLTLLLLEFEDSGDFPNGRVELYKQGIATLLIKWDAKRGIVRDQVYRNLSVLRKKDLLSQIALTTFERKEFFLKKKDFGHYIAEFIRNLPDAQTDPETLLLDSEAVLKLIEVQHGLLVERARGIYSFSHLTVQEYFTARRIVKSSEPQALEKALQGLVSHITDKSWREIFVLTVGMLQPADYLLQLMKQRIDALLAADEKSQQFLTWASKKSLVIEVSHKPAAVRAFYFNLARDHHPLRDPMRYRDAEMIRALDYHLFILLKLGNIRALDVGLDDILALACDRALDLDLTYYPYAFKGAFYLACERALILEPKLGQALQELKEQLPDLDSSEWRFRQWWETNGQAWSEKLRARLIEHRDIGYDWQFSDEQKKLLKQYYDANKLLVDCLNSDCYVSREVRQEIEETLLLPVAEIENRKQRETKIV